MLLLNVVRGVMLVVDMDYKVCFMYWMHFGGTDPKMATCGDCFDYKMDVCDGGCDDVWECMRKKAESCQILVGAFINGAHYWKPLGDVSIKGGNFGA